MRRFTLAAAGILLAGWSTVVAAAPEKSSQRPEWCRTGYSCLTTQELAEATRTMIDLREQVAVLRARKRLIGAHLVCGLGVAGIVDASYDAKLLPAGFCGVGVGW